jgi:hypothetical protein
VSDFALNVIADIRKYQATFAEIPGYTDKKAAAAAEKLAARLSKAQIDAGRSAKKAAGDAASAWEKTGTVAGEAGTAAKKLRGLAGSVDSEFAGLLGTLDDVGDAVEILAGAGGAAGPVVLGLAAAAAVAGAAFVIHARNAEIAAAADALLARESAALASRTDDLEDAQLRLAVALGKTTEENARRIQSMHDASREIEKLIGAQREERKAATESLNTNQTWSVVLQDVANSGLLVVDGIALLTDKVGGFTARTVAAAATLDTLDESLASQTQTIRQVSVDTVAAAEADERAKRTKEAHEKAARRLKERLTELSQQLNDNAREAADNAAAFHDAETKLVALGEKATSGAASGLEKIRLEEQRQLAESERLRTEALSHVGANVSARESIESDYQRTRVQIHAAAEGEIRQIEDRSMKEREKAREAELKEEQRLQSERTRAWGDTMGSITSIASQASDSLAKNDKRAARTAFGISRAAALAQVGINLYQGISEAAAAAPPPANVPLIIAATAQGAAALAGVLAVSPPKFQGGTTAATGRRGFPAVLHPGEGVANAQAMSDPSVQEAVTRGNGGRGMPAVQVVTVDRYDHRVMNRSIRDNFRLNGELRKRLNEGRRVGHRERAA